MMHRWNLLPLACACALILNSLPIIAQELPTLGDAPTAPKDVSNLPRRIGPLSVTGGFTVNIASREEVRSFYNAVYKSSDIVSMDSSANVATCTPGTNATAFLEAELRRINWLRAFAGVPSTVTFLATNNVRDQQAAVIMSRNNALNHYPPTNWFCYTGNGYTAANNSNLALGYSGPDSLTGYIWDFGGDNTAVGHRRWILCPQTQVMGAGDVPKQSSYSTANATWVIDGHYYDPRPATRTPYVAWPPPGYAPYSLVFPRWSFSYAGADFAGANITMTSNGVAVAVAKEAVVSGYGENTVAWVPMGLDANGFKTTFPFNGADTVYTVAISNIVGMPQTWYIYTVTVFDPAVPGADYFPPIISGPSQPSVGTANAYTFNSVSNATSYQRRSTLRTPYSLSDGAEAGLVNFFAVISAGYAVQDSSVKASGSYSFHLAHPDTYPDAPPDQTLTLNQSFATLSNGTLSVKSRLGYAADGETARIQVSTNGGSSWQDVYTQTGVGDGTTGPIESGFTTRVFPLSSFTNKPVQLRFNYTYAGFPFWYVAPQSGLPIGWYLDDIVLTNAELLTVQSTNATATTNFTFTPSQAGNYNLEARALIFIEFPLDWGPIKQVTAMSNTTPTIILSKPLLTNSQVWINFTLQSGGAPLFKLLQADQPQGPWATNLTATLTTNTPGVSYRYTATPVGNTKFYRVKTP